MSVLSKLKKLLAGKPIEDEKQKRLYRAKKENNSTPAKTVQTEVKASIDKAEQQKTQKQAEVKRAQVNSAVKNLPPSVKRAEARDKQTSRQTVPSFKRFTPSFKHGSTALGTMSESQANRYKARQNAYQANRKEQSRAADKLKPLMDEKYSARKTGVPTYVKQGNYAADPLVAKYNVLKHPVATSATRGGLSGATFGLSELGIKLLPKSKEAEEAERLYQANKSKGAEFAGEMAGSLAGFGLTGGLSKQALTRLAPKKVARLGESATEFLAKNSLVRGAAEREAIRKLGATATKEEIEHFAKSKAAKIVAALGEDAAINLTTGAMSDISHAIVDSDNPAEFVKNLGTSAVTNVLLGGATSAAPALRASNADDAFVRNRLAAREGLEDLARRNQIGMGRPSELNLPKLNAFPDASDAVARYPDLADVYYDYDGTAEAVSRYYNPDETAEAAVERYRDLDIQRAKPKAEAKVETPKTNTLRERIADADDFDEFVKSNTRDAEAKEYVKTNKMSGLKELWHEQRIAKHKGGIHEISIEEANATTRKAIPENVLDGWFRSGNSGYKPRLMDAIAKDPDVVNAGMNVAYHNYVNAHPESPLSFDEWLNTPQKMYRGTHGQNTIDEDIFSAYTPDRKIAEKHAGKGENARIEEIEVKPIDTLGSYQTTAEQEFLVPKSVVEASAPKTEVAAEPPKTTSKRKKTPPTREERLANSNGVDQYNARAEHQAQRFEEGYEKADNIRAALEGEEPKASAKGTKPAAESLTTKQAKAEAKGEPKNIDLDNAVNKKREKKTFREQFHELASSVKTKVSDSLNAFEEENKKYIRSNRQKWAENVGAIDKTRRYNAIAGRSIDEAQVKWNGDVFEDGKSLKAIYDGMDEATEKDFDKYLLMRHAPDRIREGKPIFAGTQYDSVEACEREARALLEKHPEFAERAEELYQYTRNELQNRVDAGLLKQEVADEWNKKYPNYVPTGRDGDFGGEYDIWDIRGQLNGNTIGAGEIKKAKGGDQPIRSIKEQLADATSRNWRDMSMNNLFRKMFGDKVGDELAIYADGGLEKVLDNTINLSKTKDGGKYFAEVFENGEMKRVEIEKSFYDAIEDLYKNGRFGNGIDVMTDAASKVAYPFKNLVTSWNPIFMVKNGLRDFPEAIINSRQTKEFLECMPAAMSELKNGGEFYTAFRNSGVSQANFVNLEEALTKGDNWLKKGANKFATAQEMVETYPRLIEYMATIKKAGYDLKNGIKDVPMEIRDIAAANAADVTVNFGRSGSVGKMLNRGLVPFFNPSVQGWSKFLRNFSEQGSAKSFIGFSLKALALGAGVQAVNNFMLEDNPNYQQISARDKATNIIIPFTWGKDVTADNTNLFVKIPKSRFASAFSLPMVNTNNENKMGWAEMVKVAGDQVAPVDPSESNILSPLLLAQQNKTWYGSPIVPKALEDLPKSEQYDANTSKIGKALGKATANLPEELQISPKKADYIIDAETGVIGDFVLPALTPSRQGGGNALQKVGHSTLNVLKRAATIDSTTQNNLSTRFYDKMQKANTASQSAKGTQADKDEYTRLSGYSKEVGKINTAIRTLQNGNRKTKQEDIYGLQKVKNQMMQDAIDGKDVPSEYKAMDAVQKYVGTTYAITNFGSATDQKAMKLYGEAKYGDISKSEMRKAINADKEFYKGVKAIGKLTDKIEKAGTTSNTALTKAVALASVSADDDLFGAYGTIYKSRTETANKMTRSRNYFDDGGSLDEYTKLEKARRTLGKLTEDEEAKALDKLDKQFAKGEIGWQERDEKEKSIKYNANISYIGLAASLAQANAPERGYRLYDIKDKNIQKGINLAAMGFTARDYKKMSKALDTNGNGYPSKQEIIDYVSKSDVEDKATLFDALYYYQGKSNPFGTPKKYTRAEAAAAGKKNGVEAISDETGDIKVNAESTSGGGYGYRRYYGGRWHSWGRRGGGSGAALTPKEGVYKQTKFTPSSGTKSSSRVSSSAKSSVPSVKRASSGSSSKAPERKSLAPTAKRSGGSNANYNTASVKYDTASAVKSASSKKKKTTVKVAPPKVKFKKYEV